MKKRQEKVSHNQMTSDAQREKVSLCPKKKTVQRDIQRDVIIICRCCSASVGCHVPLILFRVQGRKRNKGMKWSEETEQLLSLLTIMLRWCLEWCRWVQRRRDREDEIERRKDVWQTGHWLKESEEEEKEEMMKRSEKLKQEIFLSFLFLLLCMTWDSRHDWWWSCTWFSCVVFSPCLSLFSLLSSPFSFIPLGCSLISKFRGSMIHVTCSLLLPLHLSLYV